jgi:hypothetical protein
MSQFANGGQSTNGRIINGNTGSSVAPSIFPIAAPADTPMLPTAANTANQDCQNESLKPSALSAELTNELPPSNDPPSPWGDSHAKSELQKAIEDPRSRIHVMPISDIHALPIFKVYKIGNFKANFKRLYKKITGVDPKSNPEMPKKQETSTKAKTTKKPEPWQSSLAKAFLLKLLKDPNAPLEGKSDEEIFKLHPVFEGYKFDNFKTNMKSLKEKVENDRRMAMIETEMFESDMKLYNRKELTVGGYPFWHLHPSSALLEKDVEDGIAYQIAPKELRLTREEYQEFPPKIFVNHIHQAKRKHREGAFWAHKRNMKGLRKHNEEVKRMKRDWEEEPDADIRSLSKMMDEIHWEE